MRSGLIVPGLLLAVLSVPAGAEPVFAQQPETGIQGRSPPRADADGSALRANAALPQPWRRLDPSEVRLRSATALVVDQATGGTLLSKQSNKQVPIASITKVMTAMVVLDAGLALDEKIKIASADIDRLKHTRSRLRVGSVLTREDLLHVALMSSENRAAAALARTYPGGAEAFVMAMNRKAWSLSMYSTRFVDSTGLSNANVSTARDLARMVVAATAYPLIQEHTTTASRQVMLHDRNHKLTYRNTNLLVRKDSWDIGLSKTGYIRAAGRCLVMQAQIADRPMVLVLLNSRGRLSRIGDANRIKRWVERAIDVARQVS